MNFKNLPKNLEVASVYEFQKFTKKLGNGSSMWQYFGCSPTGSVRCVPCLAAACGCHSARPSPNVKCSAELNNNSYMTKNVSKMVKKLIKLEVCWKENTWFLLIVCVINLVDGGLSLSTYFWGGEQVRFIEVVQVILCEFD